MEFTADQVWGLAVAADRINGGYFKEPVFVYENECRKCITEANKVMVKTWLRTGAFSEATAADIEKGQQIRNYFNGFLLKEISGKINDFEKQALKIAQMDTFTGKNMLEFAIISCLPSVMLRDQAKTAITREIRDSVQLPGNVGETIVGDLVVIKSYFNKDYQKHRIQGRMGDSFVDFWFGSDLEGSVRIKGKIKAQRGDNTTQLNYVKKVA